MIFSRYRTILFVDKEKIRWAKGQVPGGKILDAVKELSWSENNLHLALKDISVRFPKRMRIVIGEEFSYVTQFRKIQKDIQIAAEAQALIPESLQDGWDSQEENPDLVQIMAVQQKVFAILKKIIRETKIRAEAIETESVSLGRSTLNDKNRAVLIASDNGKVLLEVARNGMVLATRIFFQFPEKEKIREFIDYVLSQKNISLDSVCVQDDNSALAKIFQSLGFSVQKKVLNPMIGICQKKDISGRDREVLNIILDGEKNNKSKGEKILLYISIMIIMGGLTAAYLIHKYRQEAGKIKLQNSETSKGQNGLMWEK